MYKIDQIVFWNSYSKTGIVIWVVYLAKTPMVLNGWYRLNQLKTTEWLPCMWMYSASVLLEAESLADAADDLCCTSR